MADRNAQAEDDEVLPALLDGALAEDEAKRLCDRLASDPALAARLEALRGVDAAVRQAYGPIADEPVPQRVLALLPIPAGAEYPGDPSRRIPLARPTDRRHRGPGHGSRLPDRLAAAAPRRKLPSAGARGGGRRRRRDSAFHDVLQHVPSGESGTLPGGWSATPRLSFLSAGGDPCRRMDWSEARGGVATVACRREDGWRVELIGFAESEASGSDLHYRPAGGEAPSPIDDAIDGLIEGSPLDREAEQQWIARGWE